MAIPRGAHASTCSVRALQAWLEAAPINQGPLFHPVDRHGHVHDTGLSPYAVDLVVKRCAAAAGLYDANYTGHSLRAEFATSAATAGAFGAGPSWSRAGNKNVGMVRRYIRYGNQFRDNAAGTLGL